MVKEPFVEIGETYRFHLYNMTVDAHWQIVGVVKKTTMTRLYVQVLALNRIKKGPNPIINLTPVFLEDSILSFPLNFAKATEGSVIVNIEPFSLDDLPTLLGMDETTPVLAKMLKGI